MKELLKDLRHGTLSVQEYKYRFDELVEYFPDLSNKVRVSAAVCEKRVSSEHSML